MEKIQQILDIIDTLTILELSDLVKALEEKYGVSAAPVAVAAAPGAAAAPVVEEKTEFDVELTSYDEAKKLSKDLVEVANKPLTIVYPRGRNLSPLLLSDDGSVGIRVTAEEFSKKLCYKFRKAIVSTSANISGEVAPKNFKEISEYIIDSVDYVVDFRRNDVSQPSASSVIKIDDGGVIKIIRE